MYFRLSGVRYLGGLPIPETHFLIQESLALVNSSSSEGMATAILEVGTRYTMIQGLIV